MVVQGCEVVLKVKIPNICQNEQRYALDILLGEFLGLAFEVQTYDGEVIEITKPGGSDDSAKLTLDASFFHQAHSVWLKLESMPVLPLATWKPSDDDIRANLVEPTVPVLYGQLCTDGQPHSSGYKGLVKNGDHFHLNLDIFGSAFFMLSRYEELITKDRDNHDRFPATASVAYKAGFLDRPIVNEYLEILWQCLQQLWPDLERKERQFRKLVSCDVDLPFDLAGNSLKRTIIRVGSRLLRTKSIKLALYDGLNYVFKRFGSDRFDEFRNNIDWMMAVNNEAGNKVAFYFIPTQTDVKLDEPFDLRSEKMARLIEHIVNSGHEVGFHPGYNTYKFAENFAKSAQVLKEVCLEQTIDTANLGGRQHFLRYDVSITPKLWQENGFAYDSTLGFADHAGFRCGVCYEYTMYDLVERAKMRLKQRPLIFMEVTGLSKQYMGLNVKNGEFSDYIDRLRSMVKQYNGDFTLLWHNNQIIDMPKQYKQAIR